MAKYRKGAKLEWSWGKGTGVGKVVESFTEDVERKIEGSDIKRKASKDEPAYLVRQEDGGEVLKSHSELRRAS